MNSKVIKFLGRTFWKEMCYAEMENIQTSLMVSKPDLKSEQDFEQFMTLEQAIMCDNVQWRFYLVEDYNSTQSAVVFKCHVNLLEEMRRLFKTAKMFVPPV